MMRSYERLLRWALAGKRPGRLLWGLIGIFVITMFMWNVVKPKVVFFPDNEPNTINTFIKMPIGTEIAVTDSITRLVEKRIMDVLGENNPIVESVVTNVAFLASENEFDNSTKSSNLAKIAVNFVQFADRKGQKTTVYLNKMRDAVKEIPGAEIVVDKVNMGPPTGKPVNIEIAGEDLKELVRLLHEEGIGFFIRDAEDSEAVVAGFRDGLEATGAPPIAAADRARLQLIRADQLISDSMSKIEKTADDVHKSVAQPVQEIQAVITGVRAALDFLFSKGRNPRGPVDRSTQDEELFI